MITFIRTSSCPADKFAAGMAFAREIAAYVKNKVGVDLRVQVPPTGGNPFRLRWVSQYENLASYEQLMQKLLSDPKYMELAGKASGQGITIPGTAFDEVWLDV